MKKPLLTLFSTGLLLSAGAVKSQAETVFVEAEAFKDHGGWVLDTQFIDLMGSPYLMAHGLGNPVDDATTTVTFPKAGKYQVWARTKDWVARWDAPGMPGRFQVKVNGAPLETEFGTEGAQWHWQSGGEIEVPAGEVEISLHDLTGFNGRCDALIFSNEPGFEPDNSSEVLPKWRRALLGLSEEPIEEGPFDIVFVGGGYAGSCGAISAARMGLKVALIQNRGVLGGNGSSEVRVWAKGNTPPGLYPIGDIIQEFTDQAEASPGTYEEFEDDKKEAIVRAEPNISLFLNHHGYAVEMENESNMEAVLAFDVTTGEVRRFTGTYFCDATGHGTIGMMANADRTMIDGGRMGMSNMWRWELADAPQTFPETPWALELKEGEFPYPKKFHAEWFWESGFDKHPLEDLEAIRDWNLRANFGAWSAMKHDGVYGRYDESGGAHENGRLIWMAYVGGTRETQQLLGDVVLTEEDIANRRPFEDGCVLTTWSIDLHYPNEQYENAYPENPFISKAVHGKGVDRKKGYPVPYRCFYSRNINNLFMAGRNISVTHEALGTIRVMKTCGMMGVVVGKAAAVGKKYDLSPRDVYYQHLDELIALMQLHGNMRRDNLDGEFYADPKLPEPSELPSDFTLSSNLPGIVVDDDKAVLTGNWTEGHGLQGYVDYGYRYHGAGGKAEARYELPIKEAGEYEIRVSWQPHENRSSKTAVKVITPAGEKTVIVNQKNAPPLEYGFYTLGAYKLEPGQPASVVFTNEGANGNVHIDAVQAILLN